MCQPNLSIITSHLCNPELILLFARTVLHFLFALFRIVKLPYVKKHDNALNNPLLQLLTMTLTGHKFNPLLILTYIHIYGKTFYL